MTENNKFIDGIRPKRTTQTKKPVVFNTRENKTRVRVNVVKNTTRTETKRISPIERPEPVSRVDANEEFIQPVRSFDLSPRELGRIGRRKRPDFEEKPKKKHKKRKIILSIFLAVLLVGGAGVYFWGNNIISKLTGGKSNLFDVISSAIIDRAVELKKDKNGRTNVLVFGTSGYDMGGSNHDGAQLTDSIMILSFNKEEEDLAIVSLPRDLKVDRTCTATGKINEVYWCKNQDGTEEEQGAKALEEKVEEILGVDIQYHAHINWGALVQIVESVDGVTVTLDEDINDPMTKTYIKAGVPTELRGEKALGLARARYGTQGGDFTRGNSQQKLLIALKEKIVEKGLGITEAINLLNVLGDNLRMNLSIDEVKSAFKMSKKLSSEHIRQIALNDWESGNVYMRTGNINGISYVLPAAGASNYTELQAYVQKSFNSGKHVREAAHIAVLNGSGVEGAAGSEKEALEKKGLNVTKVDNAPEGKYTKKYYVYMFNKKKPATKKLLEKRYKVKVITDTKKLAKFASFEADFVVVLGEN